MKTVFWLVCTLPLLFSTCLSPNEKGDRTVLANVDGETILLEEALQGMPVGLSPKDSVNYIKEYVNGRINDLLMYQKAVKNLPQTKDLDKMVENYRRSLIIYEFQQQVLNERFKAEVSEEALKTYYDEHLSQFTADNNLVKGLFLRVPKNAPNLSGLRKWVSNPVAENLEQIEAFCVQYASVFNYFMDQWTPLNEVVAAVPSFTEKGSALVSKGRTFEAELNGFYYLLYVDEGVAKGEIAPFEYAKPVVTNVLLNARKAAFLKQFEQDLRKHAIEEGQLTLY